MLSLGGRDDLRMLRTRATLGPLDQWAKRTVHFVS